MADKVTSFDIKEALALLHNKEFFITECKNGSTYFPPAQGLLKFDGLVIDKSWTKPKITIYEIKVSRGDFLQDNKWHLYLQYCQEFYFVVPTGLIKKTELPDGVGLKYYNPETKAVRAVKKALYRSDVEISADMLMYIIMNRLDSDRIPFYGSNRLEYAKDYLANKATKKIIGDCLRSTMAKELGVLHKEIERVKNDKHKIDLFYKIEKVLKAHDVIRYGYWRNDEELISNLEKALSREYPKELDDIRQRLEYDLKAIEEIKEGYSNGKG